MAANRPNIDENQMVRLYQDLGSVHKVAEQMGVDHDTVHRRLQKLGKMRAVNLLTQADKLRLKREYNLYASAGKLNELASSMGRSKHLLCKHARAIGLTDQTRPKPYAGTWKYMTEETARILMDQFKASSLTLGRYCKSRKLDDLSFMQTLRKFFPDEWEHVIESKAPLETKYRRGRRFEYRVRDVLKERGYFVMRSPASRSPIDLVAIEKGIVLFVQCKVGGELPPAGWNDIYDLAISAGAIPLLAARDGFRDIEFMQLVGRKDGSKRRQPFVPFDIEEPWRATTPDVEDCLVPDG